jgi:glucokinase
MVNNFLGGIDIGGTKIAVAIASTDGQVVDRISFPTDHDRSPHDSMNHALESLENLAQKRHGQLASIGIGCAGPLDFALGHVLTPPNMPRSWWQFPLRPFVEDKLRLPVAIENDANAAALGEHLYGAGRGHSDLVYFTISTGIGVGIIADDKLVHRLGEGGHVTVQPGGPLCACGARGCMETLCSGTGIARRARERLHSGGISKMLDLAPDIKEVTAKTVEDAAREGDVVAAEVWRETVDLLAIGIGSIITLLSPQAIILGGGVAAGAGEFLLRPLRLALQERLHIISMQKVAVLQAGLGSESVIHGALALASGAVADGFQS